MANDFIITPAEQQATVLSQLNEIRNAIWDLKVSGELRNLELGKAVDAISRVINDIAKEQKATS